ncbi:MAG: bacillithiol biosynthesis deacetylase BshB1 [Chitinophagales bacterium]|nr:bacillithiol biosynthesis deacetylase BshB1 [Chitinophagales bacterium]
MKLNILAFGAHPDDVELSCAGTLMSHLAQGKTVGIVDLTRGELGTRGTPELRDQEAAAAAQIMGIEVRENLGFADGFFTNDALHQIAIIRLLRRYQPDIVLANAIDDRHPDHGKAARLVADACFLSGLAKIQTLDKGKTQKPWRPKALYHYIQDRHLIPDFVVDISPFLDKKIEAILAYKSQFYDPNSTEAATYISSPDFLERVRTRHIDFGMPMSFKYAEGFTISRYIGITNLFDLH